MNYINKTSVLRISVTAFVIVLITWFSSCDNCFDYVLYSNNLDFLVLSKATGENVMHIATTMYNYDTVKIYNNDWQVVYPGPVRNDGLFVLFFIDPDHDKGLVGELIERRFFVYFNYQDIDTLDIAFKTTYNDCDDQVINYFKASYNDSVYFDARYEGVPSLDFLK